MPCLRETYIPTESQEDSLEWLMNGYIENRNHRPDPFANQVPSNILHETHINSHIQVEKKTHLPNPRQINRGLRWFAASTVLG